MTRICPVIAYTTYSNTTQLSKNSSNSKLWLCFRTHSISSLFRSCLFCHITFHLPQLSDPWRLNTFLSLVHYSSKKSFQNYCNSYTQKFILKSWVALAVGCCFLLTGSFCCEAYHHLMRPVAMIAEEVKRVIQRVGLFRELVNLSDRFVLVSHSGCVHTIRIPISHSPFLSIRESGESNHHSNQHSSFFSKGGNNTVYELMKWG